MEYDEYRVSEAWTLRRASYWAVHERACVACGEERADLHHLVYDPATFGNEPDSDLLPLCRQHHEAVHGLYAERADSLTLREATALFLAEMGVSLDPGPAMTAPRNHDRWAHQVGVVCPTCDAEVGQSCVKVASGRRVAIRAVHRARKAAASRAT